MWVEVSESDLCMYALVGFRGCCRLVVVFSLIGCAIFFAVADASLEHYLCK